MNDKLRFRFGTVPSLAVAALLLLPGAFAEATWLARGQAVGGAGYSVKKNLGELTDRFNEMAGAVIDGDGKGVEQGWEEVRKTTGNLLKDAFPVLKIGDAAISAKDGFKKRLKSAEEKIGRFVGGAGENVSGVRSALAIGVGERRWYASETGILAKRPLPAVSPPPKAGKKWPADPWGPTLTAASDCRRWASRRFDPACEAASARSPDPWGTAPTPAAARSSDPWGAAGRAARPSERTPKRTAATGAALGDETPTGTGDYRAALDALETREAERREAERQEAERQEAERREAERVAAAARREAEAERAENERQRRQAETERAENERQRWQAETERRQAEAKQVTQEMYWQLNQSLQQLNQQMNRNLQRQIGQPSTSQGSGYSCYDNDPSTGCR